MAQNPDKAIYLTYKTRMVAESRTRILSRILNFILAWYSFCVIALSVIDLKAAEGASRAVIVVILSVFVFGLSLIVPWLGLDEKAARYRDCYLRLQQLMAQNLSAEDKAAKYHEILQNYPNHGDSDWDRMMVIAANRDQELENNAGVIAATSTQIRNTFLSDAILCIGSVFAFVLPGIVAKALG